LSFLLGCDGLRPTGMVAFDESVYALLIEGSHPEAQRPLGGFRRRFDLGEGGIFRIGRIAFAAHALRKAQLFSVKKGNLRGWQKTKRGFAIRAVKIHNTLACDLYLSVSCHGTGAAKIVRITSDSSTTR